MRSSAEIIAGLTHPGIIAVIRLESAEDILPVAEALLAGGVNALELTLTMRGALKAIEAAAGRFSTDTVVGAGSVIHEDQCREALAAGAEFIVSPVAKTALVPVVHGKGKVIILGAYTPTEAQAVHEAGADFVKLFPADGLGPGYIKSLRAPLPHLRVIPTGGVDLDTAAGFLQAGCCALGVGSSLVSAELVREKNWAALTRLASAFVRISKEVKRLKA
jgi:2-dehydro-3-deoxyphosphogluconate aldolase/(4S)-4-hydroxy-2-oxoglutarate aldolase